MEEDDTKVKGNSERDCSAGSKVLLWRTRRLIFDELRIEFEPSPSVSLSGLSSIVLAGL